MCTFLFLWTLYLHFALDNLRKIRDNRPTGSFEPRNPIWPSHLLCNGFEPRALRDARHEKLTSRCEVLLSLLFPATIFPGSSHLSQECVNQLVSRAHKLQRGLCLRKLCLNLGGVHPSIRPGNNPDQSVDVCVCVCVCVCI